MNAQRTESKSGIIHASKKESRYADTLDLLQREGHILGHMQQVSIPLAPGGRKTDTVGRTSNLSPIGKWAL
jgi:hypothetical protein